MRRDTRLSEDLTRWGLIALGSLLLLALAWFSGASSMSSLYLRAQNDARYYQETAERAVESCEAAVGASTVALAATNYADSILSDLRAYNEALRSDVGEHVAQEETQ